MKLMSESGYSTHILNEWLESNQIESNQ